MEPITVEVKAEHIKQGIPVCCEACPIALALQEQFNDMGEWAWAGPKILHFNAQDFITPMEAARFMKDFDCGRLVHPFTIVITEYYTPTS